MKAIIYEQYGPASVLQYKDVEKPAPQDGQVLVKVHAAAVNSLDWRRMRARPFLVRTSGGWTKPKNPRLGADLAGVVEEIGSGVTQFNPGEAVFGDVGAGSFAEFVCVSEKGIAKIPEGVSFVAAASAPVAGLTALQGLRDHWEIQTGQHVLINGASGGVGTYAVQIAKSYGAEVTGVCSTRNQDMVRSIGADHVIDYTAEDFTQSSKRYDLIYCVAANKSVSGYRRALKPGGLCVVTGFKNMAHMMQISLLGGKNVKMQGLAQVVQDDLVTIGELLAAGKIEPYIDHSYPLSETAEALRYFEEEHAQGKIVISIDED